MNPAKRAVKARDDELYRIAQLLGLKKYDSIRSCDRCGGKERYISNRGCVLCQIGRSSGMTMKKQRRQLAIVRQEAIDNGQPYFFPIHRCGRGHLSRWRTRDNVCMMCVRKAKSQQLHWKMRWAEDLADRQKRLDADSLTEEQILRLAE